MAKLYDRKLSLIDYALGIVTLTLLGSILFLFLAKWLDLHRNFEDGAFVGIYLSGMLFGVFLLFALVSVLVAQVSKLFGRQRALRRR
jgi:hypothetical protein